MDKICRKIQRSNELARARAKEKQRKLEKRWTIIGWGVCLVWVLTVVGFYVMR